MLFDGFVKVREEKLSVVSHSNRQPVRNRTSLGQVVATKSVMSLEAYLYQRTFAISRISGAANLLVTKARTADCCQKAAVSA